MTSRTLLNLLQEWCVCRGRWECTSRCLCCGGGNEEETPPAFCHPHQGPYNLSKDPLQEVTSKWMQYSGTPLNRHPSTADTHDIMDNSESPDYPSLQEGSDIQVCHQRLTSVFDLLLIFFFYSLIQTLTLTPPSNNANMNISIMQLLTDMAMYMP